MIAITPPRRRYRVPGRKIERERGGVWTLRRLVLAVTQKDPPPNDGGDKKARTERCVGCTPLVRIWEAKRDGVWVAHRLVCVWRAKRDGVWDAHRLAAVWKVQRAGV